MSDIEVPSTTQPVGPTAPGTTAYTLQTTPPQATPTPGESALLTAEVLGDAVADQPGPQESGEADADSEVASPAATEASEEGFSEATAEQLAAAESGAESAVSDLTGIEGFEFPPATESVSEGEPLLAEAGEAISPDGSTSPEFLGLGALVPLATSLVSSAGPAIAKGIFNRLSPRAKKIVQRPRPAARPGVVRPPQAAGLDLLLKLLQRGLAKPGGESGAESEEASEIVDQLAPQLEVIIDADDRVALTATTQVPWLRYCALRITFPSGRGYRGTGFFIGPRAIATAGHCVYMHDQGGWARNIEVSPGANGTARPFGSVNSTTLRSVAGWVTQRRPESDYGCIVLPQGAFQGRNLGSFGFAVLNSGDLTASAAVLAGYPGDKPYAELWGTARRIKTVTPATVIYDIDTYAAQSGSPVYVRHNGQRIAIGIHNYGAAAGNSATRITDSVYSRLVAWSKL
jgi:glutamyl endopeptidase